MTVRIEATTRRFNLVSSDAFPGTAIPEGSTIHVVDTGEEYIYHDGMWEQDLRRAYSSNLEL